MHQVQHPENLETTHERHSGIPEKRGDTPNEETEGSIDETNQHMKQGYQEVSPKKDLAIFDRPESTVFHYDEVNDPQDSQDANREVFHKVIEQDSIQFSGHGILADHGFE